MGVAAQFTTLANAAGAEAVLLGRELPVPIDAAGPSGGAERHPKVASRYMTDSGTDLGSRA